MCYPQDRTAGLLDRAGPAPARPRPDRGLDGAFALRTVRRVVVAPAWGVGADPGGDALLVRPCCKTGGVA